MPAARPACFRAALLLAALCASGATQAAESYDNCTGFIDSLPAVVATQGVWCLRHDLATAIATGNAIEVTVNNVTIDCNGFKIGGLAGGASSQAIGISATSRNNLTVRNCNVRGFAFGIAAVGSGHLVEDNRVEGALAYGIFMEGDAGLVRRNVVLTTGGSTALGGSPTAITAYRDVDVIDNTVDGAAAISPTASSFGIVAVPSSFVSIAGNRVRNIASAPVQPSAAIDIAGWNGGSASVRGNTLGNINSINTVGVRCHGPKDIASDNHLVGFTSNLSAEGCTVVPGNVEQ